MTSQTGANPQPFGGPSGESKATQAHSSELERRSPGTFLPKLVRRPVPGVGLIVEPCALGGLALRKIVFLFSDGMYKATCAAVPRGAEVPRILRDEDSGHCWHYNSLTSIFSSPGYISTRLLSHAVAYGRGASPGVEYGHVLQHLRKKQEQVSSAWQNSEQTIPQTWSKYTL